MRDELIAIIPARAGSKGVPRKNLRKLVGIPLVQRAIQSALDSGMFSAIYVSSDDAETLDLAARCGAVPVERPGELATDTALMTDVVRHLDSWLRESNRASGRAFALLQPTSPLRSARHIRECTIQFLDETWASAVSVSTLDHPPQKALVIRDGRLEALLGLDYLYRNRQQLEPAYRQNGCIWIVDWTAFRREQKFVIPPVMAYRMAPLDSIDIDSLEDLQKAEEILSASRGGQAAEIEAASVGLDQVESPT